MQKSRPGTPSGEGNKISNNNNNNNNNQNSAFSVTTTGNQSRQSNVPTRPVVSGQPDSYYSPSISRDRILRQAAATSNYTVLPLDVVTDHYVRAFFCGTAKMFQIWSRLITQSMRPTSPPLDLVAEWAAAGSLMSWLSKAVCRPSAPNNNQVEKNVNEANDSVIDEYLYNMDVLENTRTKLKTSFDAVADVYLTKFKNPKPNDETTDYFESNISLDLACLTDKTGPVGLDYFHKYITVDEINDSPLTGITANTVWGGWKVSAALNLMDIHNFAFVEGSAVKNIRLRLDFEIVDSRDRERNSRFYVIPASFFFWWSWIPGKPFIREAVSHDSLSDGELRWKHREALSNMGEGEGHRFTNPNLRDVKETMERVQLSTQRSRQSSPPQESNNSVSDELVRALSSMVDRVENLSSASAPDLGKLERLLGEFAKITSAQSVASTQALHAISKTMSAQLESETERHNMGGKNAVDYVKEILKEKSLTQLFFYLQRTLSVPAPEDGLNPDMFVPITTTAHSGKMTPAQLLYRVKRDFAVEIGNAKSSTNRHGIHLLEKEVGQRLDQMAFHLALLLRSRAGFLSLQPPREDQEKHDQWYQVFLAMEYQTQVMSDQIYDIVRTFISPSSSTPKPGEEDPSKNPIFRALLTQLKVPGNIYASPEDLRAVLAGFDLEENRKKIAANTQVPLLFLNHATDSASHHPVNDKDVSIPQYTLEHLDYSPTLPHFLLRNTKIPYVEKFSRMMSIESQVPGSRVREVPVSLARSLSQGSSVASAGASSFSATSTTAIQPSVARQPSQIQGYWSSQSVPQPSASPAPQHPSVPRFSAARAFGGSLNPHRQPSYGLSSSTGDCYLSFAPAVRHAVSQLPLKKNLTPLAAEIMNQSTPLDRLKDLIAEIAGCPRRDVPSDAVDVCNAFLAKADLTPTQKFGDVLEVTTTAPDENAVVHALLLFDSSSTPGHWITLLKRPETGKVSKDQKQLLANWYIKDEREEYISQTWIGSDWKVAEDWYNVSLVGWLIRKPLLGLGREDKCKKCGKNAHSHSHSNLSRTCSVCGGVFLGECALPSSCIPARRRDAGIQSLLSHSFFGDAEAHWECEGCNRVNPVPPALPASRRIVSAAEGLVALGRAPAAIPAPVVVNSPAPTVAGKVAPKKHSRGKAPPGNPVVAGAAAAPAVAPRAPPPYVEPQPQVPPQAPANAAPIAAGENRLPPPPYRRNPHDPSDAERTWILPPQPNGDPPQDFSRPRVVAPHPGDHAGVILNNLTLETHDFQNNPFHPQTTKNHFNSLRDLIQDFRFNARLNPRWLTTPLPLVLEAFLMRRSELRFWKPQTLLRNAATLHGAFANLPLYSNCPVPIQLSNSPLWSLLMSSLKGKSNMAQPRDLPAVSVEDINLAISSAVDLRTQIALILQWYLGARVGDILRVSLENVVLHPNNCLQVRIDNGKVMAKRLPYTVHSFLPPEHGELLKHYFRQMTSTLTSDMKAPLFPTRGGPHPFVVPWVLQQQRMRAALRMANVSLNTRAIRRGALQTMASQGVPTETLMTFSGHTNVETLKRYLDYGRHLGSAQTAGQQAATLLAGSLRI
jgi:integrase